MTESKDKWSTETYTAAASFVPALTSKVLTLLSPSPTDKILDLGCGDGLLTSRIAASIPSGSILGLDSSPSFIKTANTTHSNLKPCSFHLHDCRKILESSHVVTQIEKGGFDKVFSNAALHWILRDEETRVRVFKDVNEALKKNGTFVFEMGGKGNVEAIHATLVSVLLSRGIPRGTIEKASPWFFPSEAWMRDMLEQTGFEVLEVETEYRPTKCTEETEDGKGGLEGWVRLMAKEFLDCVGEGERDEVVRRVCEVLEVTMKREEDGSLWIGYVRLRVVARKV